MSCCTSGAEVRKKASLPDSLASRNADSRVEVVVPTDSLEVLTPPDTEEVRKVTATMRTDVLDVAHYPEIRLTTRSVGLGAAAGTVAATLVAFSTARPQDPRYLLAVVPSVMLIVEPMVPRSWLLLSACVSASNTA